MGQLGLAVEHLYKLCFVKVVSQFVVSQCLVSQLVSILFPHIVVDKLIAEVPKLAALIRSCLWLLPSSMLFVEGVWTVGFLPLILRDVVSQVVVTCMLLTHVSTAKAMMLRSVFVAIDPTLLVSTVVDEQFLVDLVPL